MGKTSNAQRAVCCNGSTLIHSFEPFMCLKLITVIIALCLPGMGKTSNAQRAVCCNGYTLIHNAMSARHGENLKTLKGLCVVMAIP